MTTSSPVSSKIQIAHGNEANAQNGFEKFEIVSKSSKRRKKSRFDFNHNALRRQPQCLAPATTMPCAGNYNAL